MLLDVVINTVFDESGKEVSSTTMLDECGLDSLGYLTVWLGIDEWVVDKGHKSVLTSTYIYEVDYGKTSVGELVDLVLERSCDGDSTK